MKLEDLPRLLEIRQKAIQIRINKIKGDVPNLASIFTDRDLEEIVVGQRNIDPKVLHGTQYHHVYPDGGFYVENPSIGDPFPLLIDRYIGAIGYEVVVFHETFTSRLPQILTKGLERGHEGPFGHGESMCLFEEQFYHKPFRKEEYGGHNWAFPAYDCAVVITADTLHEDGLRLEPHGGWGNEVRVMKDDDYADLPPKYISAVVFRYPPSLKDIQMYFDLNPNISLYADCIGWVELRKVISTPSTWVPILERLIG